MSSKNGDTAEPRVSSLSHAQSEFRRLLPLWQKEREQFTPSSNTADYWRGPHGRAIISLGPAIIPQVIDELRKGDFFFNVPLSRITNVKLTTSDIVSEQEKARQWLKWWSDGDQDGPKNAQADKYIVDSPPNFAALLAHPKRYHGKKIRLHGLLHLKFEETAIYSSSEHADNLVASEGFWVAFNETAVPHDGIGPEKFHGRWVMIEGTFDMHDRGHLGLWSGTVKDIDCIMLLAGAKEN